MSRDTHPQRDHRIQPRQVHLLPVLVQFNIPEMLRVRLYGRVRTSGYRWHSVKAVVIGPDPIKPLWLGLLRRARAAQYSALSGLLQRFFQLRIPNLKIVLGCEINAKRDETLVSPNDGRLLPLRISKLKCRQQTCALSPCVHLDHIALVHKRWRQDRVGAHAAHSGRHHPSRSA